MKVTVGVMREDKGVCVSLYGRGGKGRHLIEEKRKIELITRVNCISIASECTDRNGTEHTEASVMP